MHVFTNTWNNTNFKNAYGIGNITTAHVSKEPTAAPMQIFLCVAEHEIIFLTIINNM
jgi:hypothetical protein